MEGTGTKTFPGEDVRKLPLLGFTLKPWRVATEHGSLVPGTSITLSQALSHPDSVGSSVIHPSEALKRATWPSLDSHSPSLSPPPLHPSTPRRIGTGMLYLPSAINGLGVCFSLETNRECRSKILHGQAETWQMGKYEAALWRRSQCLFIRYFHRHPNAAIQPGLLPSPGPRPTPSRETCQLHFEN